MSSGGAPPRPVRWAILGTGSIANDMVRFGVDDKKEKVSLATRTHTCSFHQVVTTLFTASPNTHFPMIRSRSSSSSMARRSSPSAPGLPRGRTASAPAGASPAATARMRTPPPTPTSTWSTSRRPHSATPKTAKWPSRVSALIYACLSCTLI